MIFYFLLLFIHVPLLNTPLKASVPAAISQEATKHRLESDSLMEKMLGTSPLHRAIENDDYRGLKTLLKRGYDIEVKDTFGRTPLHYAAYYGNKRMCRLLIENKAMINALDNGNHTPLHYATGQEYFGLSKLLLEKGAFLDLPCNSGNTSAENIHSFSLPKWQKLAGKYTVEE